MAEYSVIAQRHRPRIDPDTGDVMEGWDITVRDELTKVTGIVFIPDVVYPDGAQAMIRELITSIRSVHSLTE